VDRFGIRLPQILASSQRLNQEIEESIEHTLNECGRPKYYGRKWLDFLSLMMLFAAGIFILTTPITFSLLIFLPNEYISLVRNLLLSTLLLFILLVLGSGILGNLFITYNERENKWRWRLHYGRGNPETVWGNSLFPSSRPREEDAK